MSGSADQNIPTGAHLPLSIPKTIREAYIAAFHKVGGSERLAEWALDSYVVGKGKLKRRVYPNLRAFFTFVARIAPQEVKHTVEGIVYQAQLISRDSGAVIDVTPGSGGGSPRIAAPRDPRTLTVAEFDTMVANAVRERRAETMEDAKRKKPLRYIDRVREQLGEVVAADSCGDNPRPGKTEPGICNPDIETRTSPDDPEDAEFY